jgi:hypothetical protein
MAFFQNKVCTQQHQKYVNCLKKSCLMYTAQHCQDLSFPFPRLTWYSFAIGKCRNFWWICLSESMIQNSKMSGSSEPQIYLSPVKIQHYFSNELIHFDIQSLKYHNVLFFYIRKSTAASGFMVTDKHYMLPCAYILYAKSYGRVMTSNFKVRRQFYNEILLYFVLLFVTKIN